MSSWRRAASLGGGPHVHCKQGANPVTQDRTEPTARQGDQSHRLERAHVASKPGSGSYSWNVP